MIIASLLKKELQTRQEKNVRYSLRSFAKLLDVDGSFLSKVMQGKKYPSEETFRQWGARLGLSESEIVDLWTRQKQARKTQKSNISVFTPLAYEVFEKHYEWYYPILLEYLALSSGPRQLEVASEQLAVPLSEIKIAVSNMLALGILEKSEPEQGPYRRARLSSTYSLNLTSDRLRGMQLIYLEKASKAIHEVPVTRRENTTVTLALDEEDILAVREILRNARQKVAKVVIDKNKPRRSVYNVTMALYPVLEGEVAQ